MKSCRSSKKNSLFWIWNQHEISTFKKMTRLTRCCTRSNRGLFPAHLRHRSIKPVIVDDAFVHCFWRENNQKERDKSKPGRGNGTNPFPFFFPVAICESKFRLIYQWRVRYVINCLSAFDRNQQNPPGDWSFRAKMKYRGDVVCENPASGRRSLLVNIDWIIFALKDDFNHWY